MSSSGRAAFNFARLPVCRSYPLSVFWVVLVNSGSVELLIVIGFQSKEPLILGELIPITAAARLLKAAIESIVRIGDPRLKNPLVTESIFGDGSVGSECSPASYIKQN